MSFKTRIIIFPIWLTKELDMHNLHENAWKNQMLAMAKFVYGNEYSVEC